MKTKYLIFYSIFLILFNFGLAKSSRGATYYIAASGSDSNNGTTKDVPWQHAPGMANCTANCAAITPQPGDKFILRGGDVWHHESFPWHFEWGGSAGNYIYIGVDQTWYSGSAWSRPVFDHDNPIVEGGIVESCAYNDANIGTINLTSIHDYVSYVHIDNFEIRGVCWSSEPTFTGTGKISTYGYYNKLSNMYFHGWTHTADCGSACNDNPTCYCDGGQFVGAFWEIYNNVFDGAEGDGRSMYALYGGAYNTHHNVIRYMSNAAVVSGVKYFHDNLLENINNSFDSHSHPNVYEDVTPYAGDIYIYNNVFRNSNAAVNIWTLPYTDAYYFNNVVYGITSGVNYWVLGNWGEHLTANAYFYNNTFHWSNQNKFRNVGISGNISFLNNHFITDYWTDISQVMSNEVSSPTATITESHSLYQTNSAANSQGYAPANAYSPIVSGSTINAGTALSCSGDLLPLCSSISGVAYDSVNHIVVIPWKTAVERPQGSAWDIGAYEYVSRDTTPPAAPSGLNVN